MYVILTWNDNELTGANTAKITDEDGNLVTAVFKTHDEALLYAVIDLDCKWQVIEVVK